MTLAITNEDVARVLTMKDTIAKLEALYGDLGTGSAVYRGRTDLFTPSVGATDDAPGAFQFKTLDGAIPRWNIASIRLTSDVVSFPLVDGKRRRVKVPAAAGNRFVGLVFLFDSATGELISVLQDGLLQRYSVGAVNAIGAKYLARPESEVVALFGAGGQSVLQLKGLKEVLPIRRVQLYTPSPAEADAFAQKQSAELGLEIVAAANPEAALDGADVVVTATNSREPFFPAKWAAPGMHLSCLQRDEAMDDCFTDFDIVVFHTRAKEHEYVSTDFAAMEKKYDFKMGDHPHRATDWNAFPDLGELVAGKVQRRTQAKQRTFFLNSTGVGAQYSAVAHLIFTRALEEGLGRDIPGEFFTESISG